MSVKSDKLSEDIEKLNLIDEIMHHASKNAVAKLNNRGLDYLPLNPKNERRNVVVFENISIKFGTGVFFNNL